MVDFGYTMMCEQAGPKQLVRDVGRPRKRASLRGHRRALLAVARWPGATRRTPGAFSVQRKPPNGSR